MLLPLLCVPCFAQPLHPPPHTPASCPPPLPSSFACLLAFFLPSSLSFLLPSFLSFFLPSFLSSFPPSFLSFFLPSFLSFLLLSPLPPFLPPYFLRRFCFCASRVEIFNAYMHCYGCETILHRDLTLCLGCHAAGRFGYPPVPPEAGLLTDRHHCPGIP